MTRPGQIARGRWLLRSAAAVVGGVVVLWFLLAITVANTLRDARPETALKWAWFDAGAMARQASKVTSASRGKVSRSARDLAKRSVARDATNVEAVRNLGLFAAVDRRTPSLPLFRYAESLSRRDLPTQLWFIEYYVAEDDIPNVLKHYDIALRTSPSSGNLLFPILQSASRDEAIAKPLRQLMRSKPNWWLAFAAHAISQGDPVPAEFLTRGLLSPTTPGERELLILLLNNLTQAGRFDLARATYGRIAERGANDLLRHGSFEEDDRFPPFDWWLAGDADLTAERRARADGKGLALYFRQAGGRGGIVARQLLQLPAGSYRLSLEAGDTPADGLSRPKVAVNCAGAKGPKVTEFALPAAPQSAASVSETFVIPQRCTAQWLTVNAPGRMDMVTSEPWIDSLRLQPL